MKTSKLIKLLLDSLIKHGDLELQKDTNTEGVFGIELKIYSQEKKIEIS